MLSDFFKVVQTAIKLLDDCADTTETGSLELLASIEGFTVLDETNVICANVVYEIHA